jgi:fucose permease
MDAGGIAKQGLNLVMYGGILQNDSRRISMFQLLLVIIYLSFISLGLPDSLLGSAWPSMYAELGVPVSYAGIVSMLIAGCTIISSLFSDKIVRKLGTGRITALSVGMTAAALMGFSFSHSFALLCAWAVPYGLGAGSVDAALNNFVALHYKARHMNWLHCFWGIGASIGPYIMGACLTGTFTWSGAAGWNGGYRVISLIQILLTAILILSLPLWNKKSASVNAASEEQKAEQFSIRQLLMLPSAKQILVAFFCYCALESTTGLWGAVYMVMQKGISKESAAKLIALFYLGITVGRFISGFLSAKLSSKNMIRLGQLLASCGVIVLFTSNMLVVTSLGFILVGLGCAPIYPALLHQTPDRFGKNASQSIMGMQMAAAYIGSTFMPPVAGFIVEHVSVTLYPVLLILFLALMTVLIEYCNRRQKKAGAC